MFPLNYKNNKIEQNNLSIADMSGKHLSSFISSNRRGASQCICVIGSITVETAVVLPFFVSFMVFLMFFFRIIQVQTAVAQALTYAGRSMAAESSFQTEQKAAWNQKEVTSEPMAVTLLGSSALFYKELKKQRCPTNYIQGGALGINLLQSELSGDYIELKATYRMRLPIGLLGPIRYQIVQEVKCRKWTGYHPNHEGEEDDGWLYYTEYGTVYHTSRECSYLDLSIHGVPKANVSTKRNESGGIYYQCSSCGDVSSGMVYITNYGDRYHSSLACSGLKRTIYMIRRSKATDKRMCKKCG